MQLLALHCLDHLMLWDFLTLITTAIVYRYSKLDNLHTAKLKELSNDKCNLLSIHKAQHSPSKTKSCQRQIASKRIHIAVCMQWKSCGQGVLHALKVSCKVTMEHVLGQAYLPYAGQKEIMVQGGKHQQTPHCEYKLYGTCIARCAQSTQAW